MSIVNSEFIYAIGLDCISDRIVLEGKPYQIQKVLGALGSKEVKVEIILEDGTPKELVFESYQKVHVLRKY